MNLLRRALAGLLSAALAAGPARAADEAFRIFEEEAMVIAASKHPQSARSAPAGVHVITAEEIRSGGYRTLSEALTSVPGFYSFTDRNYEYLWVRGFGRPGDYTSRILLLLDGHRLNDNIYGSMFLGRTFLLDMRSVERIEVVSGPGSALHGNNAFLAVVNVIPRRAEEGGAGGAAVEAGGFGERSVFADASLRRGDRGLYVAGSGLASRGQDHRYPQFSANGGVAAGADGEEAHNGYASLEWGKIHLHGGQSRRSKQVPTAAFSTRFNDAGTHTVDWRRFIEGAWEGALPGDVSLHARVYYDWYGYYGNYVYVPAAPPPGSIVNRDELANDWWGTELRARWTGMGESNALTVGAEFERDVRAWQTNYDQEPFAFTFADDRREARVAAFVQQELKPLEALAITAGLRCDRYQAFGYTCNPRLGAVYALSEAHILKALYGSAFRAPNYYERFYSGAFLAVNPSLRPEIVKTYEARYEYYHDAGTSFRLSYLQSRVKDLISQVVDDQGVGRFVNKERLRTDAVEASGQWAAGPWSGRLAYTVQSTREAGGDRLSNSPTHVAAAGVLHRWGSRASLGGGVRALSRRRTVKGTTLPAAGVFDANARVLAWAGGPVVVAALRNAFDASYAHSGANEHVQDSLKQDGRSFFAGVEYAFGR